MKSHLRRIVLLVGCGLPAIAAGCSSHYYYDRRGDGHRGYYEHRGECRDAHYDGDARGWRGPAHDWDRDRRWER